MGGQFLGAVKPNVRRNGVIARFGATPVSSELVPQSLAWLEIVLNPQAVPAPTTLGPALYGATVQFKVPVAPW